MERSGPQEFNLAAGDVTPTPETFQGVMAFRPELRLNPLPRAAIRADTAYGPVAQRVNDTNDAQRVYNFNSANFSARGFDESTWKQTGWVYYGLQDYNYLRRFIGFIIDKPNLLLHASFIVYTLITKGPRGYLRRGEPEIQLSPCGTITIVELERYRIIQALHPRQEMWQALALRENDEPTKRLFFSRGRDNVIMAVGAYQGHTRRMLAGVNVALFMMRYYGPDDVMDLPEFAFYGARRGPAEEIVRHGILPGMLQEENAYIHVTRDLVTGYDRHGMKPGTTHVVVVELKRFARDCFTQSRNSIAIWESYSSKFVTEGKMPADYYDAEGRAVGSEAQRAQGLGVPVAYINRVYNITTGQDMIVLNTGVPAAERRACFGGSSSLELIDEEGLQLAKRIRTGDISRQSADLEGVPDYPHPGVPIASLPAVPENPAAVVQVMTTTEHTARLRIAEANLDDAVGSTYRNEELKEDCARLLVDAAREQFNLRIGDGTSDVGVPESPYTD